jgi:hypothetical protein
MVGEVQLYAPKGTRSEVGVYALLLRVLISCGAPVVKKMSYASISNKIFSFRMETILTVSC